MVRFHNEIFFVRVLVILTLLRLFLRNFNRLLFSGVFFIDQIERPKNFNFEIMKSHSIPNKYITKKPQNLSMLLLDRTVSLEIWAISIKITFRHHGDKSCCSFDRLFLFL